MKQKVFSLFLCCIAFVLSVTAQQHTKSDLRILYVGGTADLETSTGRVDKEMKVKSIRERMAAFEKMLKEYFTSVTVIRAEEYRSSFSYQYDVTVMDGVPTPITPRQYFRDEQGKIVDWKDDVYFPEDFDRPVVTVAELGGTLGRGIGLKTDSYCLCLDADAHHFRAEHPIFKGPFPVSMTVRMEPTPADAYHFPYFVDGPIPDSILMWKVQTKGYMTDKGYRVGLVSKPWGFEDSPDAEYISSGVCQKTLDAVAIGRHGNFLHWGFSASPADMTEEARTVFANAIVYISGFAGKGVIARKYNDLIATRDYLKEKKFLATKEGWKYMQEFDKKFEEKCLEQQKAAHEKKARGETLFEIEEIMLDYKPHPPVAYEDFVKRYHEEEFERFGTDEKAYIDYYDTNKDYFYGGGGTYRLVVDEDVKSLGIPNNDLRLLEAAIRLLEKGQDVEKARRILERYTLCRFKTPREWRNWYETNKKRLFFTEAGGWLFMVNSREPSVVGNDYRVRDAVKDDKLPELTGKTDEKNPVLISVGVMNAANGNKEVVVRMKIHPGYHTYAYVAKEDPYIVTTLDITLPEGYEKVGKLSKPSFKLLNQQGTTIYENEAVFRQEIKGKGPGKVKCLVGYQCCDNHICMPPTENEYVVEVK